MFSFVLVMLANVTQNPNEIPMSANGNTEISSNFKKNNLIPSISSPSCPSFKKQSNDNSYSAVLLIGKAVEKNS